MWAVASQRAHPTRPGIRPRKSSSNVAAVGVKTVCADPSLPLYAVTRTTSPLQRKAALLVRRAAEARKEMEIVGTLESSVEQHSSGCALCPAQFRTPRSKCTERVFVRSPEVPQLSLGEYRPKRSVRHRSRPVTEQCMCWFRDKDGYGNRYQSTGVVSANSPMGSCRQQDGSDKNANGGSNGNGASTTLKPDRHGALLGTAEGGKPAPVHSLAGEVDRREDNRTISRPTRELSC